MHLSLKAFDNLAVLSSSALSFSLSLPFFFISLSDDRHHHQPNHTQGLIKLDVPPPSARQRGHVEQPAPGLWRLQWQRPRQVASSR